MAQQQKQQVIAWKPALLAVSGIVVFGAVVFVSLAYALPRGNRVGESLRRLSPLPVVVIGYRDVITTEELASNMRSVRRFYETQDFSKYGIRIDFSTEEGKQRLLIREKEVLNKMLEDRILMQLAHEKNIVVTPEAARDGVRRQLEEYGGDESKIRENLKRLYDWSLQDFEEKVVMPNLYEERLTEAFKKESDTRTHAEQRIKEAREAIRGGMSFDEAVSRYSEGRTREQGGELGWFATDNLARELQRPIAAQKVGVIGDILESELGFHIVVVEESKQENGKMLYRIKQIFAKKTSLADWMVERMRASPPTILSRDYIWDADTARIEFRDESMRRFEKELIEKTLGESLTLF